jgi:capsular exopolysaccharide synthesis family protein
MLVVRRDTDSQEAEPYKTLRTAVRFVAPDRPLKTLLVTSAGPDEGKTTTAANLAVAIALSGERVVVLDADLRRARLGRAFGLDSSVGLTSLVLGTASIQDALQSWDRGLQVMASGPLPPNPSEIVGSQLFNQLLQALSDVADFVVIDAPPVLPVSDAIAIAAQVDGVLLVARHGKTPRNAAAEARRKLAGVGANVVGYVLNAVPARDVNAYYSAYDYATGKSSRSTADR